MNRVDTYTKLQRAFYEYREFLLHDTNSLEINSNSNIEIMKLLFSLMSFIINKDKIKMKDESSDCYIENDVLDELIRKIAIKKNNKYYIGDISFDTSSELLKTLRDKIAHGDFDIEPPNIILNINGKDLILNMSDLSVFIIGLTNRLDMYTTVKEYHRFQTICDISHLESVNNIEDINKLLSKIKIVNYRFKNKNGLTSNHKEIIEGTLSLIVNGSLNLSPEEIKKLLKQMDIDAEITITPVSESKHINQIMEYINFFKDQFITHDLTTQIAIISNLINKLESGKEILQNDFYYNFYFLNQIKDKYYDTYLDAFSDIEWMSVKNSYGEMVLTLELIGFYINYYYPLESVFKSKDGTNEEYFDYRKLDLSSLKPDIFVLPETRLKDLKSSLSSANNKLNELLNKYEELTKQKEILLSRDPNHKGIPKIDESLASLKKQIEEGNTARAERTSNLLDFLREDDSYYHNRYLIEYMRNAIAHGNIFFDYAKSNGDYNNFKIRFINEKDGKVYLDLTISTKELEELLNNNNFGLFKDFIDKKGLTN